MPNHVHLIIYKLKKPLFKIMQVLKGYTSGEINKILNRKGKFWHTESYDNVIRSRNELANKIKYVVHLRKHQFF
jgi:REP element-mobilizing transposase RayT